MPNEVGAAVKGGKILLIFSFPFAPPKTSLLCIRIVLSYCLTVATIDSRLSLQFLLCCTLEFKILLPLSDSSHEKILASDWLTMIAHSLKIIGPKEFCIKHFWNVSFVYQCIKYSNKILQANFWLQYFISNHFYKTICRCLNLITIKRWGRSQKWKILAGRVFQICVTVLSRWDFTAARNAVALGNRHGPSPGWFYGRLDFGCSSGLNLSQINQSSDSSSS